MAMRNLQEILKVMMSIIQILKFPTREYMGKTKEDIYA